MTDRLCPHTVRRERWTDTCTLPAGHSCRHEGLRIAWSDRYHGDSAHFPPALCPTCRKDHHD